MEFYSDSIHQHTALDVIQLLYSKNYFNFAKINIVPCICVATLSFGHRVDGWLL